MQDMLVKPSNIDFDVIDGKLIINGATIGTKQEIISHLRKSEKCDILEEELFLNSSYLKEVEQ